MDKSQTFAVYGKGTPTSHSAGWSFLGWSDDVDAAIKQYTGAEFIKYHVGKSDEKTVWTKRRGYASEGVGMGDMSKDPKKA